MALHDDKVSHETGIVRDESGKPCRTCMDFRSWIKMQRSNSAKVCVIHLHLFFMFFD